MVHYRERKENYGKTAGCIMSPAEALSRTTRHLTSRGILLKEIVVDEPYFFQAAMLQVRKK
jgi:hypothetical protein